MRGPNYIAGAGPDTAVSVGGIVEIIVALACIGTAVALYPVVKTQNEGVALGFVGSRVLEADLRWCRDPPVDRDPAAGRSRSSWTGHRPVLIALYNRTFFVGQSFLPAVNALLLGSLLYQSRLVPRVLPLLGFVGAALLVASDIGILFNVWAQMSPVAGLAALPIAIWEFALGVYLIVRGFKPSPLTSGRTGGAAAEASPGAEAAIH